MITFSTEYYSEECNGIKLIKLNYNERKIILNSQKEFFLCTFYKIFEKLKNYIKTKMLL